MFPLYILLRLFLQQFFFGKLIKIIKKLKLNALSKNNLLIISLVNKILFSLPESPEQEEYQIVNTNKNFDNLLSFVFLTPWQCPKKGPHSDVTIAWALIVKLLVRFMTFLNLNTHKTPLDVCFSLVYSRGSSRIFNFN